MSVCDQGGVEWVIELRTIYLVAKLCPYIEGDDYNRQWQLATIDIEQRDPLKLI
jgi:hypothetical protein